MWKPPPTKANDRVAPPDSARARTRQRLTGTSDGHDGMSLAAWGFVAVFAFLGAITAYQFSGPVRDGFRDIIAGGEGPSGDPATTASIITDGATDQPLDPRPPMAVVPPDLADDREDPRARSIETLHLALRSLDAENARLRAHLAELAARVRTLETQLVAIASGRSGPSGSATSPPVEPKPRAATDSPAATAAPQTSASGSQSVASDAPVITGSIPATPATKGPVPVPVARTDFAIDLGGHDGIPALREGWRTALAAADNLGELEPLAQISERGGALEVRLVAGPFRNAAEAAKRCAQLSLRGIACRPTQYVGQRFAVSAQD